MILFLPNYVVVPSIVPHIIILVTSQCVDHRNLEATVCLYVLLHCYTASQHSPSRSLSSTYTGLETIEQQSQYFTVQASDDGSTAYTQDGAAIPVLSVIGTR